MKAFYKKFYHQVRRELNILIHDSDLLLIVLVAPLFYGFFYGSVYLHKLETDVPIVVVNQDHHSLARQLIRQLNAHPTLKVTAVTTQWNEAQKQVEHWQAQGLVWIPADFSQRVKQGRQTHLKLFVNNSRFLPANDINRAVQQVVSAMSGRVRLHAFLSKGLNVEQAFTQIQPLRVDDRNLFNWRQSYGDFLIPGLLALILQQTLLFGLAMSVAQEFEHGTRQNWFNTAQNHFGFLLAGKVFVYLVLYLAYTLFFFSVTLRLLRVPFRGHYFSFLVMSALFLVTVSIWAVFIGSFFKKKIVALQLLVFTSYPLFLLSGFSWPLAAMPRWVQAFTQLLPSTPFFQALPRMVLMGANLTDVVRELLQLIFLLGLGLAAGIWRFNRLKRKQLATVY